MEKYFDVRTQGRQVRCKVYYNNKPQAEKLLILHGTADEIVPFESERTFAAQNGIAFLPVENADHRFRDPACMSLANQCVMRFFELIPSTQEVNR